MNFILFFGFVTFKKYYFTVVVGVVVYGMKNEKKGFFLFSLFLYKYLNDIEHDNRLKRGIQKIFLSKRRMLVLFVFVFHYPWHTCVNLL